MKKIVFLFLLVCSWHIKAQELSMAVSSTQYEKLSLYLGIIGQDRDHLFDVANRMKADCMFSGQFEVTVESFTANPSPKQLKKIADRGFPLAIFLSPTADNQGFEWRLYDTLSTTMVEGKRYHKRGTSWRGWAHNMSDAIWPVLTGKEAFFSSKLAYCKDARTRKGKTIKFICTADFDGTFEHVLVRTPTINIGPRWNADHQKPLLFYSEYTRENVRLMVCDMRGKRKIASDFEGINMLPSFSHNGKEVVYCASRGDGACQLYLYTNKEFKCLTNNKGNNVSPSLSSDGSMLYFCSDYQTGSPQIYSYDMHNKRTERLTSGGYCASPSYSSSRNQVVYAKMIEGTMQLMLYDCSQKTHAQLTHGAGNKEEATWSSCGNYVTFCVSQNNKSRIALLNLLTNQEKYLTSENDSCSYPSWSPHYNFYPTVA